MKDTVRGTQVSSNWYFISISPHTLPLCLLTVSLNVNQYEPAKQISHKILDWVNFFLNVMSQTEHWHSLSDRWKMSEWVISSCLDEWQSDTLWCGAFCKMLWQLHLSIVGFSSRLCGIIDLSSASSSTISLLLLSGQQFIIHLHFFSFFCKHR